MKKLLLITLTYCVCFSCKAQDSINIKTDTMREKLDIELLKKEGIKSSNYSNYDLTKEFENGSKFRIWGGDFDKYYVKEETPPLPYFYMTHKKYGLNGYLVYKYTTLGKYTIIGKTQQYDSLGKLTEVNEDAKFGKIKPRDVLNFLEQKGYINQQTGEGRDGFNLSFLEKDGRNIWYIVVWEGRLRESPPKSWQFQSAYEPFIYEMDAETGGGRQVSEAEFLGEIDQIPKDPNPSSSIYKTYKGRNYTEKEWKDFVEKDVQAYLQRKNRSFLAE